MRIENTLPKKVDTPIPDPSWDSFFSHFSEELSTKEKDKMIEFFHHQLSHEIDRQMQRMIRVYKKMKEDQ